MRSTHTDVVCGSTGSKEEFAERLAPPTEGVETRPIKMIATSRRTWLAWLDTSWAVMGRASPVGARVVVAWRWWSFFGGAART